MPFKPPLTLEELHDIGARNKGNADVLALLWEIKRLHAVVLRADQVIRSIPYPGGGIGSIVDAFHNEIKDDPVVIERKRQHKELFEQKVEPGDDD